MTRKNKHLVYFYRFKLTDGIISDTDFHNFFLVDNARTNSRERQQNLILYISDKHEDSFLFGRLVKIRVGTTRRINVDDGKEWYEQVCCGYD